MPTCSQAKILTNLESGIQKRLFKLSSDNKESTTELHSSRPLNTYSNEYFFNKCQSNNEPGGLFEFDSNTKSYEQHKPFQVISKKLNKLENSSLKYLDTCLKQEHGSTTNIYTNFADTRKHKTFADNSSFSKSHSHLNNLHNSYRGGRTTRRISVEELPVNHFELTSKRPLPKINNGSSRVPANFLYNSAYRTSQILTVNQLKINNLRASLDLKETGSDGEQEDISGCSDVSDKSSVYKSHGKNLDNAAGTTILNPHPSTFHTQMPKIVLDIDADYEPTDEEHILNSKSSNTFKSLKHNCSSSGALSAADVAVNAKRLLALASIRPSLTFHKSMTAEEIMVLKKYYEILKPKVHNAADSNEKLMDEDAPPPLTYDTAKINFSTLKNLKQFIEVHKPLIENGEATIEYDAASNNNPAASSGFVLKNNASESVIRFPSQLNDAFFALSLVVNNDKEATRIGEANLYRVLNWNDTSSFVPCGKKSTNKKTSLQSSSITSSSSSSSSASSATSVSSGSELNFDYIRNLSSLVGSVVPPKLTKQLKNNALDVRWVLA